jgi:hypothetical protein
MRRVSVALAIAMVGVLVPITHVQAQSLTASCRADLPVKPGVSMTWRATVQGNVGTPAYEWTGTDGLTGTGAVTTHSYASTGFVTAHVAVTDPVAGENAGADCGMHVLPASYVEPPSVTPVLWVPKGVDPSPLVGPLQRTWRAIHALFFHFYGKTFRMRALKVVVSTHTEADLCGGDCTDAGKADTLAYQALAEASAAIGGEIPYTRAMLVMAWGAGGWAGGWSWDYARGLVGDFAIAPAAYRQIPHIEPNVGDWLVQALGLYDDAVFGTIAHELNHVIAWDDPHDFSLYSPPNQYERGVARAGPWLTRNLADAVPPTIDIVTPVAGSTITGTADVTFDVADGGGMDAVVLLADLQVIAVDRSPPFAISLDTTKLSIGDHELAAVAFDTTGNTTETAPVTVHVANEIHDGVCDTSFPVGRFRACFYDGVGTANPYLGSWLEAPFPYPATNVAKGPWHDFGGEVAFGRSEHVTGVWRGTFNFPPGNYQWRFHTDDGLQVWIGGQLVVDAWNAPQIADFSPVVSLSGRTKVKIRWYENQGGASLRVQWSPPTT